MASSGVINQFNEQWRQSPLYQQGLQAVGEPTNGPITLDGRQRKMLLQWMQQQGVQVPQGAEIDPAGNANEDEGFSKHKSWIIPAAIGLGTLGVGALGAGPAAGLFASGTAPTVTGASSALTSGITPALGGSGFTGMGLGAGAATSAGTTAALGGGLGAGTGTSMAGGISGFLGGLGKQLGGDFAQRALGSAGSALAGGAQASANNRGVALDAEQQAALIRQRQQEAMEAQLINRAQEDRDSMNNAFTNSVQSQRVLNSTGYKPASLSMVPGQGPSTLPSFGTGFKAPTDSQRSDAQALYNQASTRLSQKSGLPDYQPPTPYQNDPNLMKQGAGEKIGGWLGPALSFAGAYRPQQNDPLDPNQRVK